jgi:hypothetical protein
MPILSCIQDKVQNTKNLEITVLFRIYDTLCKGKQGCLGANIFFYINTYTYMFLYSFTLKQNRAN